MPDDSQCTVEVFKKNGVDVMAVWQDLGDPKTLIYLLSYRDRAARDAGWDKMIRLYCLAASNPIGRAQAVFAASI